MDRTAIEERLIKAQIIAKITEVIEAKGLDFDEVTNDLAMWDDYAAGNFSADLYIPELVEIGIKLGMRWTIDSEQMYVKGELNASQSQAATG